MCHQPTLPFFVFPDSMLHLQQGNSVCPDTSDRRHSSISSGGFQLHLSRTRNRGRPDITLPLLPPNLSHPSVGVTDEIGPCGRPSLWSFFASTWDGSFIYAAPHITSLARLFVSPLNPVVAATAGGRIEALSPSPLENGLLPPINSTSQRISVNQASGRHEPSLRSANSVGFLDSDLAKTPREWLARNTAVFV